MAYWRLYLSTISSLFSSLVFGMVLFYPSSAFPDINGGHYGFKLSLSELSWFASFAGLFAMPGSLIAVPLMEKYGRKFAIVINKIPMTLGWLLIVLTYDVPTMGVGRALTGLALGMEYSCESVYLSEMYPKHMRGVIACIGALCVTFGGLLINFLDIFVNWRWTALVALVAQTASVVTLLFMYETPRWLIIKNHQKMAAEVIENIWCLKDAALIEREIVEIEANIAMTQSELPWFQSMTKLMKPPLLRPLTITQLLVAFQQFQGNAYIMNYTLSIIQEVSVNSNGSFISPKCQNCLVSLGYCIGTILSIVSIDRLGRRILLFASSTVICISLTVIGVFYYFQHTDVSFTSEYLFWLPLVCLIGFVLGFSMGYAGVPFLIQSEMFPMSVRGIASGLCSFSHNLNYFMVVKVFPSMEYVPNYGIFWIYAGVAFVSCIFVFFYVPETKGLSLEEIQELWYPKTE